MTSMARFGCVAALLLRLFLLSPVSSQLLPYHSAPSYLLTFDDAFPASYASATAIPAYIWTECIGSHRGLASYDGTTTGSQPTQLTNLTLLTDVAGRSWPAVLGSAGNGFSIEFYLNLLSVSAQQTVVLDVGAANGALQDNIILAVDETGQIVLTVWVGDAVNTTMMTTPITFGGNVWQHVILSVAKLSLQDSTSNVSALYTVYINGAQAGSTLGYLPASVPRPYAYINGMNAPAVGYITEPMLGQVDQFALYDYAIDAIAAQLHATVVRPPVFELGLAFNPHIPAQQPANSIIGYNYTTPTYFYPHINTTTNGTYYTNATGTPTIVLNATLAQYIDLNAASGLHSVGLVLPVVGGTSAVGLPWGVVGGCSFEVTFALLTLATGESALMHLATSAQGVDDIELWFASSCIVGNCTSSLQLQLWQDGNSVTVPIVGTVQPLLSYHIVIAISPAGDVSGGLLSVFVNGLLTSHQAVGIYPRAVARSNAYIGRTANSSASVPMYTSVQLNLFRVYDYSVSAAQASCLYSYALLDTVNNTQSPVTSPSTGCAAVLYAYLLPASSDYSIDFPSQPASNVPFSWYAGDGAHAGLADFSGLANAPLSLTNYSESSTFPVPTGAASFTFETWMELPDQETGRAASLLELSNAAGGQLVSFIVDTTAVPYTFALVIGNNQYSGPLANLTTGTWQHVVVTMDNTHPLSTTTASLTLYVNGQRQYVEAVTPPAVSYRAQAMFGRSATVLVSPLIAAVDSVTYYSQPISAKAIAAHSIVSRLPVYELTFPVDPRPRLGYGLDPSLVQWTWAAVDSVDARHTGVLYFRNGVNKSPNDATAAMINLANTAPGAINGGLGLQPPPTIGGPSAGVDERAGWTMEFSFILYNYNSYSKLFSCGDNSGAHGTVAFGLSGNPSTLAWQVFSLSQNNQGLNVVNSIPLNTWYHVVVVMQPPTVPGNQQSSTHTVYVNGQYVNMMTTANYPDDFNRYDCWLMRSTWGDPMMDAAIDALRMYDYALSPQEIANLATLALTGQVPAAAANTAVNPVGSPPLTHTAPRATYNFDTAHSYTGTNWFSGQQDPISYLERLGVMTLNGADQWGDLALWPDDYASFLHSQLFPSFSVELWSKVYPTDAGTQYSLFDIGSPREGSARSTSVNLGGVDQIDNVYLTVTDTGALQFGMYGGGQVAVEAVASQLTVSLWQHVVVSVNQSGTNNGTYAVFVNGALATNGSFTGTLASSLMRQHVYIGRSNVINDTSLLTCQIDSLYVYDYALPSAAVSDHVWLPRQPQFELVFQSDPRWALNASTSGSSNQSTYQWNVTCGQCYPNYVQATNSLLSNCTNSTVPLWINGTLTDNTTVITNCTYYWYNTTGYQPNSTNTWDGNGVLLLQNGWTNSSNYQAAWVDLTTTSGVSTVGAIAPVVGDEDYGGSLGAVYTGWTFEVEVQFHLSNSSQQFPYWSKVFSLGSSTNKVELGFQQNGTLAPYLGFQVVSERSDLGHGSGNPYPLLVPQMDVWYHIVISVQYTGTAYAPYSATYTAYINGVAVMPFTAGTYPMKAVRSFATLGSTPPSNIASQYMVDALLAIDTFRVYDVAVTLDTVVLMYSGLHGIPPSVPSQPILYDAGAIREYTFDAPLANSSWLDGTHYGYMATLGSHAGVVTFTGDQYIDLLSFTDNSQNTWPSLFGGAATIELWVYHFSRPTLTSRILDMAGLGGATDSHIYLRNAPCSAAGSASNTNSIVFGITNAANVSAVVCVSNVTWTVGKWQHIAITIQPNTLSDTSSAHAATTMLYVDGERVVSAQTPLPTYASHPYCYISNSRDAVSGTASTLYSSFEGAIDLLSLYNTPLPAESILAHYLVNPTPYYELNFNLDPRINYIASTTTSNPLYTWLDYDPMDAPLPVAYNHHQGMVQFVQSAAKYEWIDLSKATGPNSAGVTVPMLGGVSDSAAYAASPGWSFEITFKAGTRTSWAKMFCMGNGANVDNILIGWDGHFTTNLTISFQSFDQYGNSQLLKVLTPTEFDTWYHIVVTVEPSGLQTSYVNGAMTNYLIDGYYPRAVTRSESYLGKSEWGADSYFNMKLDTFRVYDTSLSPAQVELLYAATLPDPYTPPASSSSSSSSTAVYENGALGRTVEAKLGWWIGLLILLSGVLSLG